jgi:hypothetical protein
MTPHPLELAADELCATFSSHAIEGVSLEALRSDPHVIANIIAALLRARYTRLITRGGLAAVGEARAPAHFASHLTIRLMPALRTRNFTDAVFDPIEDALFDVAVEVLQL